MTSNDNPPSQKLTMWPPRCMSISEFCAWACVSRSYAYSEITAGRLRVTKFGRSSRILVEDAEAWLMSRPALKPRGVDTKNAAQEADRNEDKAA